MSVRAIGGGGDGKPRTLPRYRRGSRIEEANTPSTIGRSASIESAPGEASTPAHRAATASSTRARREAQGERRFGEADALRLPSHRCNYRAPAVSSSISMVAGSAVERKDPAPARSSRSSSPDVTSGRSTSARRAGLSAWPRRSRSGATRSVASRPVRPRLRLGRTNGRSRSR